MSTEEQKAVVAAERATIKVQNITPPKEEVVEAKTETNEEAIEEATEEVAEEIATEEVTEEVAEESEEVKTLKAQLEKERQKFEKRINKKTAESKEMAAKLADLEKIIAAKTSEDGDKLTREEAEKLAEQKAEAKVAEREFANACNRLAEDAKKNDKEFDKKITQLSEDVAPLPGYMIGILDDLDNGGLILNYFTNNPDEYEETIALSQAKMGVKLAKLSNKLEAEAKIPPEKVSEEVPEPITPVGGKGGGSGVIITEADTKNMQDYVRKRQMQVEQRRKAGHLSAR